MAVMSVVREINGPTLEVSVYMMNIPRARAKPLPQAAMPMQ
jgi:hypothetical protein